MKAPVLLFDALREVKTSGDVLAACRVYVREEVVFMAQNGCPASMIAPAMAVLENLRNMMEVRDER